MIGIPVNCASVLIISDDTEFARTVAASWQTEKHIPEITVVASDLWHPSGAAGYGLLIVGPVASGPVASGTVGSAKLREILSAASTLAGAAALHVASDEKEAAALRAEHPHLLVVPRNDGWTRNLITISTEVLRRVEAVARAQRAERQALESQHYAMLGRYMLQMRPSVNNALTSVVGNADLLLLEPGAISGSSREQIQTVHNMALRLNEIMQRFSSLASEVKAVEKESHPETQGLISAF
jgi:signal transduction histidine kinase